MDQNILLSVRDMTKSFSGVKALDSVSIDIYPGKVHGLLGANGAGKSTLIKILAGAYMPDSGSIVISGKEVHISNPHHASELGLSFIHQELNLVENFTVAENVMMGFKKAKKGIFIDWPETERRLQKVVERVGFRFPLKTQVKHLSVADKWLVAIMRAIYQDTKVIAMDEPTASLSESEVEMLFSVIRELTKEGIGIIYVSHRLDEVLEICDEVTIFKDGKKVLHDMTQNLSKEAIINAIAGHDLEQLTYENRKVDTGKCVLEVMNLQDEKTVRDISFHLYEGEILGISGLVGSGRTELIKMIFGANKMVSGSMRLFGKEYKPRKPKDAVKAGIGIIPEERRTEGLITNQNVGFNINIPYLEAGRIIPALPFLSDSKMNAVARRISDQMLIKTNGMKSRVLSLSGGNQQKVVIGKWVERNPRILIMDEPTRGVDVGARAEIYKLIRKMADEGMSFIIVSSDVEELPGLCDRVIVMSLGRISGELKGENITKDTILRLCYKQE